MISDARALQHDHVPGELYHREGAIEALTTTLRPVADGFPGDDAFIFGPSGTGKTTVARHVVELLQQENLATTSAYVNAMSNSTRADALYALAQDAGLAHDLRKEGTPASRFLARLEDVDGQVIAILDEVHVLQDYNTLQALWETSDVTLLIVCLDEERLFAEFSEQLRSRFAAARTVHLDRYTTDEMADILRGRVDAGLQPGVIGEDTLRDVADRAAGDARRGIALLRSAVEHAMAEDLQNITSEVVDAAESEARADIRENRVRELDTDKRLLLEIVRDAGELDGRTLHSRYENQAQDPVAKSTRRKYLARLQEYDLIERAGSGPATSYTDPHA